MEELLKMAEFVLKNNYFKFGNKIKKNRSPELQLGLNLPHHTPYIKFSYEYSAENIPFLDVKVGLKDGKITTDLTCETY